MGRDFASFCRECSRGGTKVTTADGQDNEEERIKEMEDAEDKPYHQGHGQKTEQKGV